MISTDPKPEALEAPPSLLRRLDRDENLLHIVCGEFRGLPPAVFYRVLELEHFPPCTRSNDDYTIMLVRFAGDRYCVCSIPARCRPLAEMVAIEIGWRLADGVPHCISATGIEQFPMRSPRVWTLEPRPGSLIYAGPAARDAVDAALRERAIRAERKHYEFVDSLHECWWQGRLWKRMADAEPKSAPPGATDVMVLGEQRGKPSMWYTTDPRNESWRPYPR